MLYTCMFIVLSKNSINIEERNIVTDIIAIDKELDCTCYKIEDLAASEHFPCHRYALN